MQYMIIKHNKHTHNKKPNIMNTANVNISLNFEQILNIISQLPSIEKIKLHQYLVKETSKESEILKGIKQGLDEVKQYQDGKIKLKSLDQVLDGL